MSAPERQSVESDVTGWCAKANHEGCNGTLRTGVGFHWFCACTCHPEPATSGLGGRDRQKAIDVWRAARARVTTPEVHR